LPQVFSQLEEDNLFLIQNQQEADEELEELQAKRRDTQWVAAAGRVCGWLPAWCGPPRLCSRSACSLWHCRAAHGLHPTMRSTR
jgi:hypothetical protein